MKLSAICAIIEAVSPYAIIDTHQGPSLLTITLGTAPSASPSHRVSFALSPGELNAAHVADMLVEHHARNAVQQMNAHLSDGA